MTWEVEVSDEFLAWYDSLKEDEWETVNGAVGKLAQFGPTLGRPYVDTKTGNASWYIDAIRRAEAIYAKHLKEIGE